MDSEKKTMITASVLTGIFALYLLLSGGAPAAEEQTATISDSLQEEEAIETPDGQVVPVVAPEYTDGKQPEQTQVVEEKTINEVPLLDSLSGLELEEESAGIQDGLDLLENPLQ